MINVCDLVTGAIVQASADELPERSELVTQRSAAERAAALTRSSTKQWERAREPERCVLAVLMGAGSAQQNVIDVARQHVVSERRPLACAGSDGYFGTNCARILAFGANTL